MTKHDKDRKRGLYNKYEVSRMDGSPKHDDCRYFVLDLHHDRHAIPALVAYADSCDLEFPALASDLRKAVDTMPFDENAYKAMLRAREEGK